MENPLNNEDTQSNTKLKLDSKTKTKINTKINTNISKTNPNLKHHLEIENKSIAYLMQKIEDHSYTQIYNETHDDIFLKLKSYELNDAAIFPTNIANFRKLAISKGGFLFNNIRKTIYKKLLMPPYKVKNSPLQTLLIKTDNNKFKETTLNIETINKQSENNISHIDIINRDINRSVYSHLNYFSIYPNEYTDIVKSGLSNFIKTLLNFNAPKYDYYQGYHDLTLYIYLLFIDDCENNKISIMQRISELFFSDFLNKEYENKIFEVVPNIMGEILKSVNNKIYEKLESEGGVIMYMSLMVNLVLCLCNQKVKNVAVVYRVIDYIVVSHPIVIYLIPIVVSNIYIVFYLILIIDID